MILNFNSNYIYIVYNNTIDFCILNVHCAMLLNSVISSIKSSFYRLFHVFCIDYVIFNLWVFGLFLLFYLIVLLYLIALAGTYCKMLFITGEIDVVAQVLILGKKQPSFDTIMQTVAFLQMNFIMLRIYLITYICPMPLLHPLE